MIDDDDPSPDAIALLIADHDEVRELFDAYEALVADGADDDERRAVAEQICRLLAVHAAVEAEIFYPAARAAGDLDDLVDEAEDEHASMQELIEQIEALSPADERYDGTVLVLSEVVEQHVLEEEGELFPRLRGSPAFDRQELGERIDARRQDLLSTLGEEGE